MMNQGAPLRVAVIGAGAVGAVYARHIKRAGAHLTFVVRPKYVDEVKRGIRMYGGSERDSGGELLVADDVVGDVEALRGRPLEQVWICLPSTGLDDAGLEKIAAATGDALVVDLAPGLDQRSLRIVGRDRLVDGLIPFIAYQTPLPNVPAEAARAPGIAFWLPPFIPTTLSGPRAELARDVIARGGMNARVVDDVEQSRAIGSALLMGVIATLELSQWSLAACRVRLDGAVREAVDAMAKKHGARAWLPKLVASPWLLRIALLVAPRLAPLPLERYLAYHFTKVGAQTRVMMHGYLAAADDEGVEAPHLRALVAALPPHNHA